MRANSRSRDPRDSSLANFDNDFAQGFGLSSGANAAERNYVLSVGEPGGRHAERQGRAGFGKGRSKGFSAIELPAVRCKQFHLVGWEIMLSQVDSQAYVAGARGNDQGPR